MYYQNSKSWPELKKFKHHFFLKVPIDIDLKYALIRKFDIAIFKKFKEYDKIMYIDVDIIVQGDLIKVIESVPVKDDILYATKEGKLDGPYWYINTYKDSNISNLKRKGIHSFNTGMFLFKPSLVMQQHLKNVKTFALDYYKDRTKQKHFYDQSFMNYYFNMKDIANTSYMNEIYQMFPDVTKYYKNKIILHIAGIGRYKSKALIMLKILLRTRKIHRTIIRINTTTTFI